MLVFIGLAWFLTAPAMAVLIGKVVTTADRHAAQEPGPTLFQADLRRTGRPPAA